VEMTEYLTDKNGNRAHIAYFGSEKAAQTALDSLVSCRNCTNCRNCTSCRNCSNCTGCRNCTGCTSCSNCTGCTGCTGCSNCTGCTSCTGCSNCTSCRNCTSCTNCTGCREVETPLIVGPTRSDGYQFVMSNTGSVHAGCRVFENFEAAHKHWDKKREGEPLGIETLQILDYLETRQKAMNQIDALKKLAAKIESRNAYYVKLENE